MLRTRAFNLTVDGIHTYFVRLGEDEILVHNTASCPIHGNSRNSPKLTYLYRLEDKAGNYLKTGITSNPAGRYTKGFMNDKNMRILTSGARSDILHYERMIVEMDPGPLNFQRWAGAAT